MPTVDIKDDYGATGDGQMVTTTVTCSGTSLTVSDSLFVNPDDVGKQIAIQGAGTAVSGDNPLGAHWTTIAAVGSATSITLTDAVITPLSGASKLVEWGTDDAPAFEDFSGEFAGQAGVVLTLPAGHYIVVDPAAKFFTFGITEFLISGDGAETTIISDLMGLAGTFMGASLGGVVMADLTKVETVLRGQSTVTLITPAEISRFSVGDWALMCGLEMQGFGEPPNYQFHEWVEIEAIDGDTITFTAPLLNTYKSTWPEWTAGVGGPAALIPAYDGWDAEHTYEDFTILNTYTVQNHNGRSITLRRMNYPRFGANASLIHDLVLEDTDINAQDRQWEIDKCVGDVTITGGNFHNIHFQSGAVAGTFSASDCVIEQLNGTGLNVVINNVTDIYNGVTVGVGSYGAANSFRATDCDIPGGVFPGGVPGPSDFDTWTMSGGVLTRPIEITAVTNAACAAGDNVLSFAPGQIPADLWDGMTIYDLTTPTALDQTVGQRPYVVSHTDTTITMSEDAIGPGVGSGDTLRIADRTPPYWCVPGKPVFWNGGGASGGKAGVFNVLDIALTATHTLITTDEPGGFPDLSGTGAIGVTGHACPDFRLVNCTGSRTAVGYSGFPAGPMLSRWRDTMTTDIGNGDITANYVPVVGEVESITITINSTFGAGTFKLYFWVEEISSGDLITSWSPIIDLTRGPRTITITPDGVSSSPVGFGGSDSAEADFELPGDGGISAIANQGALEMFSIASPGSVTVEFQTNQGVLGARPTSVAPLRMRVRAVA